MTQDKKKIYIQSYGNGKVRLTSKLNALFAVVRLLTVMASLEAWLVEFTLVFSQLEVRGF